jgi:PAS domain S-box-containing protein
MPNPDVIRSLFTADCLLIVEKGGRVSWCDSTATDLFGLEEGSVVGWDLPQNAGLYRADAADWLRFEDFPIDRILAGESIDGVEIRVRSERTNGADLWLSVAAEPITAWEMGDVGAVLIFCHDVTGSKNALRGLEDAHAALQALVQASPLPILALEPDGRVSFWNRAAETLFGWTAAEVLGKSLPFVEEGSRDESCLMRAEDLAGEIVRNREIRRRRKDGSMLDLTVSRAPILDRHGAISGTICVYSDITQRKQMEERLRQSAKMESLGILAGGIAHDFNNLLTSILGHTSLALEDAIPDSYQARALTNVLESVDRAVRLTNEMLAYARQSSFRPEPLNLCGLIQEMAPQLRSILTQRIALKLELEKDVPPVQADGDQLRHVIRNLVMNAKEAIAEEGTVVICAGAEQSDGEGPKVFLEVQDTGCGMGGDTRERMFDPFFSTKFTGRGLGLAAVLGITQRHGGTITVESAPSEGTSIRLCLPAKV